MQTESRTASVLDLAEMMGNLPSAVAGSLTGMSGTVPRQNRRLPERILIAAHQACDLGDLDVAAQLLSILETIVGQSRGPVDPVRRRVMESLIAAHQRMWHLRYANGTQAGSSRPSPGFHEAVGMVDFQRTP